MDTKQIGKTLVDLFDYLRHLQSRTYTSNEECIHDAEREAIEFSGVLDYFKEESNAKRHPFYKWRLSSVTVGQ